MKKLVLLAVVLALGFTSVNAKKLPAVAAKLPADFKKEVAHHIDYPSFAKNNMIEGWVMMKVTLDDNSKVRIVDLSSTNPELGKHVKSELSDLTVKDTNFKPGTIYYMKVRFDLTSDF